MTEEILPVRCGCGGEPDHSITLRYDSSGSQRERHYITCKECLITIFGNSYKEAAKKWNRAMGADKICRNCKNYLFNDDPDLDGYCRCDDEYPTPEEYGCNCFVERRDAAA